MKNFFCKVVPKNLSSIWVYYCLSSNLFQRAYVGSQGAPHSTPTLASGPPHTLFTEWLLRK